MDEEKVVRFSALRYRNEKTTEIEEVLAEEVPVSLEYNDFIYTVRLATPSDLEDLAFGLSLTEGIIQTPSELYCCDIWQEERSYRIAMKVSNESFHKAKEKKQEKMFSAKDSFKISDNFIQSKEEVFFTYEQLHAGFDQMEKKQSLRNQTGATHAAAWMDKNGEVTLIREDVGRHNALDKLIGTLTKQNIKVSSGALLVTSRASYEMVHKCAVASASILAAVSAPTALAVRLADQVNLTLVGFVRQEGHTIYAGAHRFQNDSKC